MTVDELEVLITANTNELRKEMNKANKSISGLQKSAKKGANGAMDAFKKLKTAVVTLGIGKVIKDSITSGMDAIESDSLFTTVMGENADAVKSWSNEVADTLGLSAVNMQKNIGVIYNMTNSMGVAEQNALKMSKGVSVLAEDMASFYNLDSAEAFNKLRAGLTGETEPLKALGILVDENTVKQVAYSEGIAEVGAELTQEQKVLARYKAILNQTSNAQGDLARTLDSPSNMLRSLKQGVQNLGIAFSNFLMPVVKAVLPYLQAFTKVLTQAANGLSSFLGLTGNSDASTETKKVSDNVGGISNGYKNATKEAKKYKASLAGFDEMNVLTDNSADSGGSSGSAGSTASVDFDLGEYDAHLDWASNETEALVQKIQGFFSSIGEGISFENLTTAFGNLKLALEPFVGNVGEGLHWFLQNVVSPLAEWVIEDVVPAFLNLLSDAVNLVNQAIEDVKPIFEWFWENVLQPIAEWTGGVMVGILNGIGDALKWITDNKAAMIILESIALAIGLVSVALEIYNIAVAVSNALTGVFTTLLAFLTSPITLVAAAIAALIAIIWLCVEYWDEIKAAAAKCWEAIKNAWNAVAKWFSEKVVEPVKNFFVGLWNGLKSGASAVWEGIKGVWNAVSTWFSQKVVEPIKNFFTGLWDGLKNGASRAWDGIKAVFAGIGSFFSGVWDGVKNIFSAAGQFISDTVGGAFKTAINSVLGVAVKIINGFIDAINFAIGIINAIPGVSISTLSKLSVPQLARGGVVDRPTYAMIGEAGAEAVVPLERNLGYLDKLAGMLAEKIGHGGDGINLVVKLGEEAIFERFVEYGRERAFQTNGEVVFA